MEIGLFVPLASPIATPSFMRTLAIEAEQKDFAALWVAEHVVLFDDYDSEYPYSEDGKIPAGGDVGIIDPFACLSFLAACTERVRLGTGVCLVPQRNPVYTAKEAAAVDWMSNGRLDFGVGVGWLAEEFEACATPFARRGRRTREYLEVIKTLWCDEVSEYHGELYELAPCRQYPKPVQSPHPPIVFGGESDAALRRVADLGQGWYGYNHDVESAGERIAKLKGLLAERERTIDDVKIHVCPYLRETSADDLARFADLGVDQVILFVIAGNEDDVRSATDDIAERLVGPAKNL